MKIRLASPDQIRAWSYGVVDRPETINYRTQKPEKGGLFCERIFGPQKDWECNCGKYKRIRFKGKVCERCGVEITRSKVRRERMGHIELAAPVSHIWYFKGTPSRIGQVLDISPKKLEDVLYFTKYIVIDPGDNIVGKDNKTITKGQLLDEMDYSYLRQRYNVPGEPEKFKAGMGAEAIKEMLKEIDLDELAESLKQELVNAQGQKRIKLLKRLDVIEAFRLSNNRPEWMIMDAIPVIPPDIRPMVQLDGGRYATSDLNELYRRVINRNYRLKRLIDMRSPDIIIRNEKRMLQEAVDALIDNGRHGRPYTGSNNRPLKSLSDMLKGKQGRFRQNLLGKRVDYSGRSVIVVGPELKMDQCGLPKEMALELFKPFVLEDLVKSKSPETAQITNIKQAKKAVEKCEDVVWDSLEEVIKNHPVLLNRAPTLHRLGIQAFSPVLVEGRAIKLHPLCCTAFNADFDGDQMAVHLPLSAEAQDEARNLMLAAKNLLKPSDGRPVTVPTQDMVLGSYYLTIDKDGEKGEGKVFRDINEALMAYQDGVISIHAKIKVRVSKETENGVVSKLVDTTVGRVIFNEVIPQNLGYVDRTDPEHMFDFEIGFKVGKKQLGQIIDRCLKTQQNTAATAQVLDKIKALGYKYSTRSGITVAVCDAEIPPQKADILAKAEADMAEINRQFSRGFISDNERKNNFINIWNTATDDVAKALTDNLDPYNNIFMMADSGARGSINQIRQLAGMRGLISNTSGATIEMPIKANYREGLNILEYFISSRGARKGLADTALRTADSGYLTRRLVDVSQEVIIREEDCGTTNGIEVFEIREGKELVEKLQERLVGRYLTEDFKLPDGSVIPSDKLMNDADAAKIVATGVQNVKVRSVLTCALKNGVCAHCYGASLANGQLISIGEAVGIIAAQSIGEPGTQLTMRTFHTGGIANAEDITQGLPRVEELFESRKPKSAAIVTEVSGTVRFGEEKKTRTAFIKDAETGIEEKYAVPFGYRPKVMDGDVVEAGDPLTEGSINPHDVLKVKGEKAVQNYIITEVQKVYRQQGVDINDKHIEVIVRQMLRMVEIEDSGSCYQLLPGSKISRTRFNEIIDELKQREADGEQVQYPTCKAVLLGITKAALATDSFMSAASFQETTRVLTDAAIRGKVDPLLGLKENVIIGKLIPAGTGLEAMRREHEAAEAEAAEAEAAEENE